MLLKCVTVTVLNEQLRKRIRHTYTEDKFVENRITVTISLVRCIIRCDFKT